MAISDQAELGLRDAPVQNGFVWRGERETALGHNSLDFGPICG